MTDPARLSRFAIPGRLAFEASPLGGPVARLASGGQEALVALHGAHVLNWTIGGEGMLWLSPVARIRAGKGIRGGIPVCWPWFADHAPPAAGKPAHGFVRMRPWQVAETQREGAGVSLTLATQVAEGEQTLWPHRAEVRLRVTLGDGDGLALALETTNTGDAPLPLTEALHTYFRVSDIARVAVTGLEGLTYLDKLGGYARKRQDGRITFDGEVDRIYQGETGQGDIGPITLVDDGRGRRIRIEGRGSRSAVVWNPWPAKTARLGDMGSPDAFRQMVCIETANAGDDVVTLAPGARHVLGVRYGVEQ